MKCPIPLSDWPKGYEYAAMDKSGEWFFFEKQPTTSRVGFFWFTKHKHQAWTKEKGSSLGWRNTLTHISELEKQKQ
jgi:hypothetical protein